MSEILKQAQAIELSDTSAALGSGVNAALQATSMKVFEVKESVANVRKYAARRESTHVASFEMEKYNAITTDNGGDLEDGANATWTSIDNQALITFNSPVNVSVGFKISPRLLRQARTNLEAFLDRYRRKIAFDLARREDAYILAQIGSDSTIENFFGGTATSVGGVDAGDVLTIEIFESMVDQIQENEYEPNVFIAPSKLVGQLRRDARLLNSSDFSVAIKEDGKTVTSIGDVVVQNIKGKTIIPQEGLGNAGTVVTYGYMMDTSSAFGVVDFLKRPGASPVQVSTGTPDPTLDGANFWRILGQQEIEAKVLDGNAIAKVTVALQ